MSSPLQKCWKKTSQTRVTAAPYCGELKIRGTSERVLEANTSERRRMNRWAVVGGQPWRAHNELCSFLPSAFHYGRSPPKPIDSLLRRVFSVCVHARRITGHRLNFRRRTLKGLRSNFRHCCVQARAASEERRKSGNMVVECALHAYDSAFKIRVRM